MMPDQLKNYIDALLGAGYDVSNELINNMIGLKYPDDEKNYNVFIDVKSPFPYEFPVVYLSRSFIVDNKIKAHVFRGDSLCLKFKGKETVNPTKPKKVLLYAIRKAKIIIDKALEGELTKEKFEELDQYWPLLGDKLYHSVFSFSFPQFESHNISHGYYYRVQNEIYIFDSKNDNSGFDYLKSMKKFSKGKSKQFLLVKVSIKEIAYYLNDFKVLIEYLYDLNDTKIEAYLNSHREEGLIIIVVEEFNNKKYSMFYLLEEYKNKKIPLNVQKRLPLDSNNYLFSNTIPMELTKEKLFNRSSDGKVSDDYKSICVVGCGSIGSNLAELYASIGVESITLIDNDTFTDKNLLRHVCGIDSVGKPKVDSLKSYLLNNYPHLEVKTQHESIFKTEFNDYLKNQFDLVVVATGEISSEYYCLNEFLKREVTNQVALFWIEPFGISAHAIVYNREKWMDSDFDLLFSNISHLSSVSNKEKFYYKEYGCNSAYVPYSGLHVKKFLSTFILDQNKLGTGPYTYTMLTNIEYGIQSSEIIIESKYINCKDNKVIIGEVYD